MATLESVWSRLREPFMAQSFSRIKEIAAAAGFTIEELAHLTQAKIGNRPGASRQHLMDALDQQYLELDREQQRVAVRFAIEELAKSSGSEERERMAELLRRSGWELLDAGVAVPVEVAVGVSSIVDGETAAALTKALERYRSGDLSGAVTAVVASVEAVAGVEPGSDNYSRGVMGALRPSLQRVETEFSRLDAGQAKVAKGALQKSASQTVELIAAFRRNYSDVHGEPADQVPEAVLRLTFHAATFVLNRLTVP